MTDCIELKRLADRVISDRRFCGDENHKALAEGVMALIAENESMRGSCKAMGADMGKLTRERNSFRSKAEKFKAENDQLRKGLAECATSLEGEMFQKFGGQKPEDMHPVTRRDYDRDMAELAGYRAAMGKGEQS
jgi:hypothetical protein